MSTVRRRPPAWIVLSSVIAAGVACLSTAEAYRELLSAQAPAAPANATVALPNKEDSLKFGVLGDVGNGSRQQYELGEQMARLHERFPFVLMLTVGDNIYGAGRPQDFVKRFETPYKPLLDAKVKFYASLGNHDARQQSLYEPFNMGGKTYYSFKAPKEDVRFFALESSYLEPAQVSWIEKELAGAGEKWKIAYMHHPLYSSGGRHGSDVTKRKVLEPLFIKYGVSVVFAGHDHIYERLKPQNGIAHFVVGSSGQLRRGGLDRRTGLTAVGNDTEQTFVALEISGDEMYFNAISRTGKVIDSGVIPRRKEE
jgi:Calcineurin-like phosphoesterase